MQFRILGVLMIALGSSYSASAQVNLGRFEGDIIARFLSDGRNMQLEKPVTYVDPKGTRWNVPAGAITDGASIPRVLWVCCPPFTGEYRSAAVIHDYYCQTKTRTWNETHQVFYRAMRAAGVADTPAKIMYSAVYQFGPRWGRGTGTRGPGAELSTEEQDKLFEKIQEWVKKDNPSIEDIGKGFRPTPRLGRGG